MSRFAVVPRVIPCLDVRGGRVVKGTKFVELRDSGDPMLLASRYAESGADEVMLLDISATFEERAASIEVISAVSSRVMVPLTVGGGIRTVEDAGRILAAGADRVAVNTAAVENPPIIEQLASLFGAQAIVVACDARRTGTTFEVVTHAGARPTGREVSEWAREAVERGATEILLTSIDRDGTQSGYDIELLRLVSSVAGAGVIASGGAGNTRHFVEAIRDGGASAVLAASLFHTGALTIAGVKTALADAGIAVRPPEREAS